MIQAPDLMTAEELLTYRAGDKRTELVRGQLVVREPASYRHGVVAARVLVHVSAWLEQDRIARGASEPLGDVLAAETGFTLSRKPDTVRAPDVAYVRAERRPARMRGFPELAPDLAVEVRSPDDSAGDVLAKVSDWLTAGTQLVWVIDPARRSAQQFAADGTVRLVGEQDELSAAPVLEGLRLSLAGVLANLPADG
jgi:Uma2 family endonuclease